MIKFAIKSTLLELQSLIFRGMGKVRAYVPLNTTLRQKSSDSHVKESNVLILIV